MDKDEETAMIDLHCHILPAADDGAASEEESCMMARLAVKSGVTAMAATPHCNIPGAWDNFVSPKLQERFLTMTALLDKHRIPLRLYTGMEVFAAPEVPSLIRRGKVLTLGDSRYLLVEFAFGETPAFTEKLLQAIQAEGLTPIVAHPERYYFIQDDPTRLLSWAEAGYGVQLNKGSLFGAFGRRAARAAYWCLDTGCVHLIGSDAHSPYQRTPRLSDVWDCVAQDTSPETADLLLTENPARILKDQPIRPVLSEF